MSRYLKSNKWYWKRDWEWGLRITEFALEFSVTFSHTYTHTHSESEATARVPDLDRHAESVKKRNFNTAWLEAFPWLEENGGNMFCKQCVQAAASRKKFEILEIAYSSPMWRGTTLMYNHVQFFETPYRDFPVWWSLVKKWDRGCAEWKRKRPLSPQKSTFKFSKFEKDDTDIPLPNSPCKIWLRCAKRCGLYALDTHRVRDTHSLYFDKSISAETFIVLFVFLRFHMQLFSHFIE